MMQLCMPILILFISTGIGQAAFETAIAYAQVDMPAPCSNFTIIYYCLLTNAIICMICTHSIIPCLNAATQDHGHAYCQASADPTEVVFGVYLHAWLPSIVVVIYRCTELECTVIISNLYIFLAWFTKWHFINYFVYPRFSWMRETFLCTGCSIHVYDSNHTSKRMYQLH